jgi:hypothetical protein
MGNDDEGAIRRPPLRALPTLPPTLGRAALCVTHRAPGSHLSLRRMDHLLLVVVAVNVNKT